MIVTDSFQQIEIPVTSIQIKEETIIKWLGYETNQTDPFTLETIQKCILQTKSLIHPKGGYIVKTIQSLVPGGIITLDSTELHCGKIISGQIKKASSLGIFTVTIGKDIEILSEQLFQKAEMLEGYIVNLIGSAAAETLAEYIHQHIKKTAESNGLYITNRFSPGYCTWNVAEQFKLFALFPNSFSDITLTDSALMNPVKSVSGIIGIGKDVIFREYACSQCNNDKCLHKKNG